MPCSQDDCQLPPLWRPVLVMRQKKKGKMLEFRFTRLGYCQEHRDACEVKTILSDEGFHKINKHNRELGRGSLDQSTATLRWEKLDSRELETLSASQDTTTTDDTLPF